MVCPDGSTELWETCIPTSGHTYLYCHLWLVQTCIIHCVKCSKIENSITGLIKLANPTAFYAVRVTEPKLLFYELGKY